MRTRFLIGGSWVLGSLLFSAELMAQQNQGTAASPQEPGSTSPALQDPYAGSGAPNQPPAGYPPTGYPQQGPAPSGPQGYPQYPAADPRYPQYPQGYPQYPQGYPQYPQGYPQNPQGYPQYPQGYPQNPQGYPQNPQGYPQYPQAYPPAPPATAPVVPPAATTTAADQSARLTFTTDSDEVRGLLGACLDALDNYRTEAAQKKCEAAVAKDGSSAVGYALLAQAATVKSVMQKRIGEAQDAMGKHFPSEGERLLVEAILAQLEDRRPAARAALDALVSTLPGERRAQYYRGLHRYRQGDFEGALGDYQKATTLDPKFGPAYNATGHLLLRREKLEEAQKAFEKYAEVQPKEANAQDSLAILHLRKNELGPAVDAARKALELDPRFLKANARLGDALLFQGNAQAARRAYGVLMASADPAEHHDGAMRTARSRLLETGLAPLAKAMQEAEKDYTAEADTAKRLHRKADQVRALLELGRVQLERAALAEAARTVQLLRELLEEHPDAASMDASSDGKTDGKADAKVDAKAAADKEKAAPTLTVDEQTRFAGEVLVLRALLLSAIGEREDAEERAVELEKLLRGPAGPQRARELRGDMAAREGERHVVVKQLEQSVRATAKFALALALSGGKPGEQIDVGQGRGLMEELGRRNVNDLETALTRGRARSWLKANPVKSEGKPEGKTEGAAPAKLEVKSDASPAAKEAKL